MMTTVAQFDPISALTSLIQVGRILVCMIFIRA